jgi:hydrophobic/amphiphilic exporter-1 (mainly G- bacteria), HAE1 family
MFISDTAIRRPVTTLMFTAGLLIFGYIAFTRMGVDLFPEIEFPVVTVTSFLPGADPEIMDSDVTDVLESQINTIEGVKTIRSTSSEGISQIVVEFVLSKNVDVAAQDVRDKVNQAQFLLPRDLEPPIVQKIDIASQPIMWIAVTSPGDFRRMARYTDEVLRERLQTVPGVGAVQMGGFRKREIRIWLDPQELRARNLTARDVATAVRMKHIKLPGGRIEQAEREFTIKVEGEYESVDELQNLVVTVDNGAMVRLRDLARVEDGSEDFRMIARFNGLPSIGLGIRKQSGTNTVAVAEAVRQTVDEMNRVAPEDISLQVAFDSSRFIENSMNEVIFDLFLGAILTAVVMLIFLRNFRMTFISIMAIPTSIIASFVVMYGLGFTINNMTMLAMSLAIGIVIDDAIVVLENIFRHVERLGETPMQAAKAGTAEVGLAVLAASSSIMAVFIPVAFMHGVIGRFFYQFGMGVVLAVLVSVIMAFTLIPMLSSRLVRHEPSHGRVFSTLERAFLRLEGTYARHLDIALRRRWITIGIAGGLFVSSLALIPFMKTSFVTEPDQSRFLVRFEFPTGTSIYKTDEGLRRIEQVVFSQPEIRSAFCGAGFFGSPNSGIFFVNMVSPGERRDSQLQVMARMRELLRESIPEARTAVDVISPIGGGGRNSDLQFIVQGPRVEDLRRVSDSITAEMRQVTGFVDVDDNMRLNKPQVDVRINRNLADDLGVDVSSITDNFNILFGGQDVATFKEGGKRYDIRLRALPDSRLVADDLYNVALRSSTGEMINTPNLVEVSTGTGPNSIERFNRSRAVTVYANLENMALGDAVATMEQIADRHVPEDPLWSTALSGTSDVFAESFQYLFFAFGIAILVVYMILGSQFESFIHPFTIMMSLPLAIAGSIVMLLITGMNLDIFAFIGFVMLTGIVTKNAILLVDFTNQQRAKGKDREAALRMAGPLRLRPILMTAFTTMAALTPVALALSEGGEQRAPMAVAVIGGMLTSTFLTLLVIPCVYSVMDDLSIWLSRRLGVNTQEEMRPATASSLSGTERIPPPGSHPPSA